MRLPPKPILIRIVIYGSLIAFFGWQAYARFSAQKAAERAQAADKEQVGKERTMQLGDGTQMPVLELTPEEAEREFGVKVEDRPMLAPDVGSFEDDDPPPEPVEPRVKDKFMPPNGSLR